MRIGFIGSRDNPASIAWIELLSSFGEVWVPAWHPASNGLHSDLGYGLLPGSREFSWDDPPSLDVCFHWWGYRMLATLSKRKQYSSCPHVLIVDTLPDARSFAGEFRELVHYMWYSRHLAAVITPSIVMADELRLIAPSVRRLPCSVVYSPFPDRAYASSLRADHIRLARVLFSGRADNLDTRDKRMRKDALEKVIRKISAAGFEVTVPAIGGPNASLLMRIGATTYPKIPTDKFLSGAFSDLLARHSATLVAYNEFNGTIRRRVRRGLSTRAASAMLAPTLWLISETSRNLVEEIFDGDTTAIRLINDLDKESPLKVCESVLRDAWDRLLSSHGPAFSRHQVGSLLEAL